MPARVSRAYVTAVFMMLLVFAACRQSSSASANSPTPVSPASPVADGPIRITSPADGATVPERPFVDVSVAAPANAVWIIIHPTEVSDYWVQPRPSNRGEGHWRVQAFVGRPGKADLKKHFEILAVADPAQTLREGMQLTDWPQAKIKSPIIEVVRGE